VTFLSDSFTAFATVLLAHVVNDVPTALHDVHILCWLYAPLMVTAVDHGKYN
jgi:hypothetical protein